MIDTPLLALTRRRAAAPRGASAETTAARNMRQLVQLRWIAVAGQLIAVLVSHFQVGIALPLAPMLGVIAMLAIANVAILVALPRHRGSDAELFAALLLDVGALTWLLYLSGGATNPFVSLYLLQVVLGAILLPPAFVWLLLAATSLAYGALTVDHLPLALPSAWRDELDLLGDWVAFGMVALLLVLFIARISRNLSAREAYATDLARHAAEEDGIVRMGLFASSAAHELGTPLATLSVILSDWQRHPAVKRNPELQRELRDARGEVQRCTTLVADILRSVGESRGEPMARRPVRALLEEVARDWCEANPQATLTLVSDCGEEAQLPAEPALRQAIWNLLDNAAYVSPDSIELATGQAGEELAIRVRDRGPGFPPGMAARAGTPLLSTKGAGHGVGLFLAATVARRLGGSISISDRPDGGADVAMLLPRADRPSGVRA